MAVRALCALAILHVMASSALAETVRIVPLVRDESVLVTFELTDGYTPEVRDAIHLLTPRAKSPEVAAALVREMAWYDAYLAKGEAPTLLSLPERR